MSKATNTKSDTISIYAAVGPKGTIVKSSVGPFKTAAIKWAAKYPKHVVAKIGEIRMRAVTEADKKEKQEAA